MCWSWYGGTYHPCQVVSRNKKKYSAFIKFYTESGISKIKQLVSISDLVPIEHNFSEFAIGDDEKKRDLYYLACSDIM